MITFGGEALSLAAWEKRQANAELISNWVLKFNLTGIHNDWESHGDEGVDAYKFYEFCTPLLPPHVYNCSSLFVVAVCVCVHTARHDE